METVMAKLPSAHQIGDDVEVDFGVSGCIRNCTIIKVHFTRSKVLYDVEVTGIYGSEHNSPENDKWTTRLYNIDSEFVSKIG